METADLFSGESIFQLIDPEVFECGSFGVIFGNNRELFDLEAEVVVSDSMSCFMVGG
jgi:hypothetical protein